MFGMSNAEFWEDDPQLYWAYRFSFIKKLEYEQQAKVEEMQLNCWLQGKVNNIAFEVALNNALSKKKVEFPSYEKMFKEKEKIEQSEAYIEINKQMENVEDYEEQREIEYNYWARLH